MVGFTTRDKLHTKEKNFVIRLFQLYQFQVTETGIESWGSHDFIKLFHTYKKGWFSLLSNTPDLFVSLGEQAAFVDIKTAGERYVGQGRFAVSKRAFETAKWINRCGHRIYWVLSDGQKRWIGDVAKLKEPVWQDGSENGSGQSFAILRPVQLGLQKLAVFLDGGSGWLN